MDNAKSSEIFNNVSAHRFEVHAAGSMARLDYRLENRTIVLVHTEVREYQAYLFTSKLLSSSLGESKFQVFAWSHLLSWWEKRRALWTNLYRWTWGRLPGANCG